MCDTRNLNSMLFFLSRIKHVMDFYLDSKPLAASTIEMVPVSLGASIQTEGKKSPKKLLTNNIGYVFSKSPTFVKIYFVSYSHCRYESNKGRYFNQSCKNTHSDRKGQQQKPKSQNQGEVNGFISCRISSKFQIVHLELISL